MDILYTCDNNYLWLMGISVISLFENNRQLENIHIWLLGENISEENKELLTKIGSEYGRQITVIDVPKIKIPKELVSDRWPLSAFTRLYAGQLLPTYLESVLYLDCDTIVVDDLSELEKWDLSEKVFWGIKDCVGKRYKKNIGIDGNGIYINAGVLLINLSELRKISINDKMVGYISKYKKDINYADQDILNGAFTGQIGVLPPQYDVMTIVASYTYEEVYKLRKPTNYYAKDEIKTAVDEPSIIHYTTNMRIVRPWFSNTNHPYSNEFKKYMSLSPWANKAINKMVFTSNESKIIGIIELLPRQVSLSILGFLHSTLKPILIKLNHRR